MWIWEYLAHVTIYIGNITHKNCRKLGEKEHPVGLPRDVQYYWRMVRDSNPRMGCPISGFQDRRIRPLCQPSFDSVFFMTIALYIFTTGLSIFILRASHDKKQLYQVQRLHQTTIAPS